MDAHVPGAARQITGYIARAREMVPLLEAAAPRIDAGRELPPDILDAMHQRGLFRLLVPQSLGGAELLPADYIQVVGVIAQGDASTAWCMNQNSGCSMSAAYLDPAVAREVFGGERDVLAWGQGPGAKAIRAPGGWRVTGTWHFGSGSRHATWLGAHCPMFEADGTQIRYPDGRTRDSTALFRREVATIKDVWQVMGLRGTGSDSYSVTDLFVPDEYVLTRDLVTERREQGLLYRFSTMNIYASGFASVGLGVARGMLEAFTAMAKEKTPALSQTPLRESGFIQNLIATGDARLQSARQWLIHVLETTQDSVRRNGELDLAQRITIRQATTFAIIQAREVVNALWHETGATAIFDAQPFERRLRDMNSVSQQVQGRRANLETVGQYMLGMQPNLRWV